MKEFMKKSARHQAVDILNQVHISQAFAAELLDECLKSNALSGTADGRLLTHAAYPFLAK